MDGRGYSVLEMPVTGTCAWGPPSRTPPHGTRRRAHRAGEAETREGGGAIMSRDQRHGVGPLPTQSPCLPPPHPNHPSGSQGCWRHGRRHGHAARLAARCAAPPLHGDAAGTREEHLAARRRTRRAPQSCLPKAARIPPQRGGRVLGGGDRPPETGQDTNSVCAVGLWEKRGSTCHSCSRRHSSHTHTHTEGNQTPLPSSLPRAPSNPCSLLFPLLHRWSSDRRSWPLCVQCAICLLWTRMCRNPCWCCGDSCCA